ACRTSGMLSCAAVGLIEGYVAHGDARLTIESVGRLPSTTSLVPARVCLVDAAWGVRCDPTVPSLRMRRSDLRGGRDWNGVLPHHGIAALRVPMSALPQALLSQATLLQRALASMHAMRAREMVGR